MFDRHIIEDELPSHSKPIAHYTRIGNLCHFIQEGRSGWSSAWATPVQFLNDRAELSLGLEVLQRVARRQPIASALIQTLIVDLLTSPGSLETDAFQMSFSGDPDELGQWRGYGANGMGCSVITDPAAVKQEADVAGWVLYAQADQERLARKVLVYVHACQDLDLVQRALVAAACFMKHQGFNPEQEFRLLRFPNASQVKFRETGDRLVPYIDFLHPASLLPVNGIIIGPGWQLSRMAVSEWGRHHVVQGIERLLAARGLLGKTDLKPSSIPYDPRSECILNNNLLRQHRPGTGSMQPVPGRFTRSTVSVRGALVREQA